MSRVGKKPIKIPDKVDLQIENDVITVRGPLGELSYTLPKDLVLERDGDHIKILRSSEEQRVRSFHGLARSLLDNMVVGVVEGFKKKLEIVGVGYRATKKGDGLQLELGFSHPIEVNPPEGIKLDIEGRDKIVIEGIDKQKVGNFAAQIRAYRKPEPYKGKGIKYEGEKIRRKVGKTG